MTDPTEHATDQPPELAELAPQPDTTDIFALGRTWPPCECPRCQPQGDN